MRPKSAVVDLSGWLSPDEERLLAMYRDLSDPDQNDLLFKITRQQIIHYLTSDYNEEMDRNDPTYLQEELEQWLREICPFDMLGEWLCDDPHRTTLINTAWGGAGRLMLGTCEHDGRAADALYNEAIRLWDQIQYVPRDDLKMSFTRKAALAFIEEWRKEMYACLFSNRRKV